MDCLYDSFQVTTPLQEVETTHRKKMEDNEFLKEENMHKGF